MTGILLAATLSLSIAGEVALPQAGPGGQIRGLSGITRVADDSYYAVRDSNGLLYSLMVGVDRTTGAPTNCVISGLSRLQGRGDLECVVWDSACHCVWTADEDDGTIRAFHPVAGTELCQVEIPPVFDAFRYNFSFESLALHPNGLEMWTCNEEALCRREAMGRVRKKAAPVKAGTPDVDDGPRSTREHGSRIRLQRFTRATPKDDWKPAGQWMYETDRVGGANFAGKSRSGVSDLLCLEDGTLFVLEREMSIKKGFMPSFRCRIYQLDLTGADDVSQIVSLKDSSVRPISKIRVFGAGTGLAMYEGICLGPKLTDGSRSVLLISDGDDGAANRILGLRLTRGGVRE